MFYNFINGSDGWKIAYGCFENVHQRQAVRKTWEKEPFENK